MRAAAMATGTALVCAIAIGCGGADDPTPGPTALFCASETRADTFAVGLEKTSEDGAFALRLMDSVVEGQPGPPDRGLNVWTLQLVDRDGAAVVDASVRLRPWMPDHGHGTTPLNHTATLEGDRFEVGPFDLHMGGYWEFGFTIEAAGTTDTVEFGFCVEG